VCVVGLQLRDYRLCLVLCFDAASHQLGVQVDLAVHSVRSKLSPDHANELCVERMKFPHKVYPSDVLLGARRSNMTGTLAPFVMPFRVFQLIRPLVAWRRRRT
jgi:hypothetical protein